MAVEQRYIRGTAIAVQRRARPRALQRERHQRQQTQAKSKRLRRRVSEIEARKGEWRAQLAQVRDPGTAIRTMIAKKSCEEE